MRPRGVAGDIGEAQRRAAAQIEHDAELLLGDERQAQHFGIERLGFRAVGGEDERNRLGGGRKRHRTLLFLTPPRTYRAFGLAATSAMNRC